MTQQTKWLGCIAEKFTKRQISDIVEVSAWNIYGAADEVQEKLACKVDGQVTYVDLVQLDD